jgi:acetylornithine deacetylase/succinyl-diaminopimelate desuccinylase-like protein
MMEFFSTLTEKFKTVANHHPKTVSFNIGNVEGGEGINSIARWTTACFEFRSVLREPLDQLHLEVTALCKKMNERQNVNLVCETTGQRPAASPVKPERVEPLVLDILSGIGEQTRPVIRSTNINATLHAGWPSLCMGLCRSGRFHTHDEYVVLDSLEKGWVVLSTLVEKLLLDQHN